VSVNVNVNVTTCAQKCQNINHQMFSFKLHEMHQKPAFRILPLDAIGDSILAWRPRHLGFLGPSKKKSWLRQYAYM